MGGWKRCKSWGERSENGVDEKHRRRYFGSMTIHDYIKKRGLSRWRTWPTYDGNVNRRSMPAFFTAPDSGEPADGDKLEIYANVDRTHFVSLNTTRGLFRIVHYDMIIFYSGWQSMREGLDYPELQRL